MLYKHTYYYPSFGILGHEILCRLTVLSVNTEVRDCAAYEAVIPTPHDQDPAIFETVRRHGNKIPAQRAHDLFPEIEEQGLRYRR